MDSRVRETASYSFSSSTPEASILESCSGSMHRGIRTGGDKGLRTLRIARCDAALAKSFKPQSVSEHLHVSGVPDFPPPRHHLLDRFEHRRRCTALGEG